MFAVEKNIVLLQINQVYSISKWFFLYPKTNTKETFIVNGTRISLDRTRVNFNNEKMHFQLLLPYFGKKNTFGLVITLTD